MTDITIIADVLIAKLRTIPAGRGVTYDNLKPSLCGDAMFDRALARARCNVEIESRVYDGGLWFRGLGA